MKRRPFRFGVFGESARTRRALIETAQKAEKTGYSIFLIRDHFIEEPFGHQLAPLTALATVAAVTTSLRLGSLVFANDYRHPVMLAKEAATLDLLSDGRFELGIGAGFSQKEYEQAGIRFDPAGVRVGRFEEGIHVIKGLFSGEPFTFPGIHYEIDRLDNFPKPLQIPHPPILVGGGGKRVLSIAAREADIIGILTTSTRNGKLENDPRVRLAETVAQQITWIREAAGARIDDIELSMVISLVITNNRQEAAERMMRDRRWSGVTVEEVLAMPSIFIGTVDEIAEAMQERREQYGFSYFVVHDHGMDVATPFISRLAGK